MDKIYRFVFFRVSSKEVAQDLTSETFTRVFEYTQRNSEKKIDNIQAFLFRTASNLVADYYRQKSRQNISLDNDINNFVIQTIDSRQRQESPEASVVKNEQAQKVIAALQTMDKEYADMVMWHYIEGLSVKEIAEVAGRPEGTIRVMLHRGLKELRRLLV